MSISDVMSRVTELQNLIGQSAAPAQAPAPTTPTTQPTSFGDALNASTSGSSNGGSSNAAILASLLQQSNSGLTGMSDDGSDSTGFSIPALPDLSATLASALAAAPAAGTAAGTAASTPTSAPLTGAQGVLSAAQSQVGVSEEPPGSNDGPQISVYRDAVAGASPDQPWCASFVSWAAEQAGEPIGAAGQGLDSVKDITEWAASTGRLLPASTTPTPGDLILFNDRHVGIVEAVNSDGSLTTVEGNYGNAVQYVQRSPSEASGYVQM
ncbi:MAG TPA: CHAP domain-containing protein [Gaiellaceae bacterium]|nr:CHAP domain-containing protein [Gaiellaceae bacterium]